MADDAAPYSGAIEETAKAAGKALDLVRDASGPIGAAYNLLIGDKLEAARIRRLDAMTRETKRILRDRNVAENADVPEQIAIPLLESAQRESRKEMQDLWSRLLANAMDPARQDDVRPEIIRALNTLQPVDVLIMELLAKNAGKHYTPKVLHEQNGKIRETLVVVSLNSLGSAGCVDQATNSRGHYKLSIFGFELLMACRP